jgi:S1-C subfamily serine protease
MGALSDLSADIAAIVDRLGPSVVSVEARRDRPATGTVWEAGLVLTADHVIEDEANIVVGQASLKASIAGRDPGSDLALLKVDQLDAPPAPRRRRDRVRPGEIVLAIGHAGERRVTLGVVSGFSGQFRSWRGGETQALIQTTAELLPGFSGGPLLDAEGRVIGVNSWHFGRGVSRALPTEVVEGVVSSLRTHGRIRRPYLGVGAQPVRLPEGLASQVGQETGMLVVTAEAGGPAASAGVLQGDTIVRLDDQPVRQLEELFGWLRGLEVGSKHRLQVVRAGQLTELDVTLGERES